MSRFRGMSSAVIALCIMTTSNCDMAQDVKDKQKLEALVQRGATRAEVAREFGDGYTFYEKGKPSWDDLESFLQREPASALRGLRENAAKYSKIMYYTTMWRMTWIFLDEKDVIRTYYLAAQ